MAMADERGRRVDAATGIVAMVLWIVGFALPGVPPAADDTPADVTAMLTFLREEVPKNWGEYCDEGTDNFRVITPTEFRIIA